MSIGTNIGTYAHVTETTTPIATTGPDSSANQPPLGRVMTLRCQSLLVRCRRCGEHVKLEIDR
jgi:hypothetical protein